MRSCCKGSLCCRARGSRRPAFHRAHPGSGLLRVMLLPEPAEPPTAAPVGACIAGRPAFRVRRVTSRAHELDRRPQILSHVEPHFPALALVPTGRVVLRLYIDEAGGVDTVTAESADRTGALRGRRARGIRRGSFPSRHQGRCAGESTGSRRGSVRQPAPGECVPMILRALIFTALALAASAPRRRSTKLRSASSQSRRRAVRRRRARKSSAAPTSGDAYAEHLMGLMHVSGRARRRATSWRCDWFLRAARKGHVPSQHNLGVIYERSGGDAQGSRTRRGAGISPLPSRATPARRRRSALSTSTGSASRRTPTRARHGSRRPPPRPSLMPCTGSACSTSRVVDTTTTRRKRRGSSCAPPRARTATLNTARRCSTATVRRGEGCRRRRCVGCALRPTRSRPKPSTCWRWSTASAGSARDAIRNTRWCCSSAARSRATRRRSSTSGLAYIDGQIVKPDPQEAFGWLLRAARQGHGPAIEYVTAHRGPAQGRKRAIERADIGDHRLPVAERGLAQQARRRIPGQALTFQQIAPARARGNQHPHRPRQRARQMDHGGRDADHQVELA